MSIKYLFYPSYRFIFHAVEVIKMKTGFFIFKLLLPLILYFFMIPSVTQAQQSNFQIAPSPIAYPYFNDGRYDGNLGASVISINTPDMNMAGGAGAFKGRMAFSEFTAFDGDMGINMLGGTMPGIPPMTILYSSNGFTPYITQIAGDAVLLLFSLRMSCNLELQPVHSDFGSIILFCGPNINISQLSITTPFNR